MKIPYDPTDLGYFDLSLYKIAGIVFFDSNMSIQIKEKETNECRYIIKLHDIKAYDNFLSSRNITFLRVDGGGNSFGFDIAIRLNSPDIENFKILYLYEDADHVSYSFRCLAKTIYLDYFDHKS